MPWLGAVKPPLMSDALNEQGARCEAKPVTKPEENLERRQHMCHLIARVGADWFRAFGEGATE